MRPTRSLGKLGETAVQRLAKLRARVHASISKKDQENDRELAYVVVETQNLWANFCRSYLLSCLFTPRLGSGTKVSLGNAALTTPASMFHLAAQVHRGSSAAAPTSRRDEPPWHRRQLTLKVCNAMQCSHGAQLQAALSANTAVFEHLATFRHFYAHRNEETAIRAVSIGKSQYLIHGFSHPTQVLTSAAYRRTQPLILDWLDDMQAVIELMCE